ncbi:MAG: hypothetical protein ACR2OI_03135, partial [Acidimicrobiia bacterium]
ADGLYGPETAEALVAAWPTRPDECPVETDEDTLNAITAIVDGTGITFNDDVACLLGPDDSGSIAGTAADGSTIAVTPFGTAARVVIDGPSASVDAPVTSVSDDQALMTIEAGPPETEVLVALSFCTEG